MRVIYDLQGFPQAPKASVVTIGNFDGVHVAHQELLNRVVRTARAVGAVATAVTFEPHPARILAPEFAPKLLTPLEQKARLIEKQGVDILGILRFTHELAHLSPQEFVRSILVEKLRALAVHVGPTFRFGYQQAGDVHVLSLLARQEGFELKVLPVLKVRGERASSTRTRELLSEGRVHAACRVLGRPFSVCGPVVRGIGVGKTQTVPTLNLAPVEGHLPKIGVYITRTRLGAHSHESVTNVGHKPTFGQHRLTVESYLLNFSGQAHESEMEIEFLYRLRDEIKFPNPAALKAQIQMDVRRSLSFFRLLKLVQEHKTQRLLF